MRDYAELVELIRSFACNQYPNCRDCEMILNGHECRSAIERQAADAIEELLAAVPKWISVEERLPEKHKVVLFYIPWNKTSMIGWIDEGGGINLEGYGKCYDFSLIKPSHWMPLPSTEGLNEA